MIESLLNRLPELRDGRVRNPLEFEHLRLVQDLYSQLVQEDIFDGLPRYSSWLKFRYLRSDASRTLALAEFPDTIAFNREAFYCSAGTPNCTLLKGLLFHELLHLVLGYDEGHSDLFRIIEADWRQYPLYQKHRAKFVEHLNQKFGSIQYLCPNCHASVIRVRPLKPGSACSECCDRYNDGEWSDSFTLITVGHRSGFNDDDEERREERSPTGNN